MAILPKEIWTEVFKCCEADSLAGSVPVVCKLFEQLSNTNEVWKAKSVQRGLDLTLKKPQETFKAFYYFQHLPLFPLYGIEIGKTTETELKAMKDAESNPSRYVTLKKVNFWYNNDQNIFKMMYLVKNIYILPPEWADLGINYELSLNSLLVFLKEYNHNYQIQQVPSQKTYQNRNCLSAIVQTIGKCGNIYYSVAFNYNYAAGTVDSKGTLYSISVNASNDANTEKTWKRYYENNVCDTMGYKIPNEDEVRQNLAKELQKFAPKLVHRMKIKKATPKIIPLVSVSGVTLPNDIWQIIFHYTDDFDLAGKVPRVCKSLRELSSNERVWESKCLKAGRKNKLDEETWKQYYFIKNLPLFPLYGIVIDRTTEQEILARVENADKAAKERYATINQVNFWFNNTDSLFKMMYIVRGIYPMPPEWVALGINFEKSYQEYLNFFKERVGNYQVVNAPSQKFHSFLQKASFDATVNVCCRHDDIYFMMTFAFGYVPGNTRSKNTLYSISLRGAYNQTEKSEWRDNFDNRIIDHKDPVEDPEESVDNPNYGQHDHEDNVNNNNHDIIDNNDIMDDEPLADLFY